MRPEDEELTIKTGNLTLGGWLDFRAERSVERCASSLVVDITERCPNEIAPTVVEPGSPCQAWLGSDLILTGYIDRYMPHADPADHRVALICRSKTEDIVDCSPMVPPWSIAAASIGAAARQICQTYNIEVVLPDGDAALDATYPFPVNPGMTCWQLLEELARSVQMLVWDDAQGRLVIAKVGTKRAGSALSEGWNIELVQSLFAMDERFSDVWVVTQAPVLGTDGHLGTFAKAHDDRVPRKRIHMVVMEAPGPDSKWAQQRADWEIARRYGRSRQTSVTVTGWRDGKGALWAPNTVVHIEAASQKISEDWVIADAAWLRSPATGTQTVLRCMPKDGLIPEPFHPLPPVPLT